jgi:hypothetical protein
MFELTAFYTLQLHLLLKYNLAAMQVNAGSKAAVSIGSYLV